MSVPTHNLYDFVHQATKRKFYLKYFYPYGSRSIGNICHYQINQDFFNGPNGIDVVNRTSIPPLPTQNISPALASQIQPVILCHDQEPLNFDLYLPDSEEMQYFCNLYNEKWHLNISKRAKNLNLRACNPTALQNKWVLLHSEIDSFQVKKYESTDLFVGAYWWSHAIIALDWYRYAEHDQSIQTNKNYSKLFLTYCRDTTGSRLYRKEILDLISYQGLTEDCVFHSLYNKNITSESSAIYESADFNNTAISVVLETVFDERVHLTEKILRPIACGHPFILAAGPRSLSTLRHYGFKTFSPYINESYDLELDPKKRLKLIVAEMSRIQKLPLQNQKQLISCCYDIAEFNRKRFFNKEFFNQIVEELQINVDQAYHSCNNRLDFDTWWNERKWERAINNKGVHVFDSKLNFNQHLITAYRLLRRINHDQ